MTNFSWKKALWKAAKTGLVAAAATLVATGDFDSIMSVLQSLIHVPFWAAPIVLGAFTLIRNYIKQWVASQNPPDNFAKK